MSAADAAHDRALLSFFLSFLSLSLSHHHRRHHYCRCIAIVAAAVAVVAVGAACILPHDAVCVPVSRGN